MRPRTLASTAIALALAIAAAILGIKGPDPTKPIVTGNQPGLSDKPALSDKAGVPNGKIATADKKTFPKATSPKTTSTNSPAPFDHYVLSLSWSPSWCAENDASGTSDQCDPSQNHGFIVHGLWPDNPGQQLEFCATRQSDRVPDSLIRTIYDLIPSAGLAGHEWRKHGTCSGLTQTGYFQAIRAAYDAVHIPSDFNISGSAKRLDVSRIESMMLKVNPDMPADGLVVTCQNGQIDEIRMCMTPELGFTACPAMERQSCRAKTISIPPIP